MITVNSMEKLSRGATFVNNPVACSCSVGALPKLGYRYARGYSKITFRIKRYMKEQLIWRYFESGFALNSKTLRNYSVEYAASRQSNSIISA